MGISFHLVWTLLLVSSVCLSARAQDTSTTGPQNSTLSAATTASPTNTTESTTAAATPQPTESATSTSTSPTTSVSSMSNTTALPNPEEHITTATVSESTTAVTASESIAAATASESTAAATASESTTAATASESTTAATASESTTAATASESTAAATANESTAAATASESTAAATASESTAAATASESTAAAVASESTTAAAASESTTTASESTTAATASESTAATEINNPTVGDNITTVTPATPSTNTSPTPESVLWPEYNASIKLQNQKAVIHGLLVPIPFPFYDRVYQEIYIYGNGYASLGKGPVWKEPPLFTEWPYSPALIGVYWADIEFPEKSESYLSVIEDKSRLENVNASSSLIKYIKSITKDNFNPLYAVAATWVNAKPKPATAHPNDEATFQLVLATDGINSYAIRSNISVWSGTEFSGRPLVSNFYSGKDGRQGDGKGVTGKYPEVLKFFDTDSDTNTYSDGCVGALQVVKNAGYNDSIKALPPCPCYQAQATADPRFKESITTPFFCYNTVFDAYSSGFGLKQICCYDGNGLLVKAANETRLPLSENKLKSSFDSCCGSKGHQLCEWYFEELDLSDCSGYKPPTVAGGFGDPHIMTFDNVKYTFRGLGDYIVFQSEQRGVELQGQTNVADHNTTYFEAYVFKPARNASTYYKFFIGSSLKLEGIWTNGPYSGKEQYLIDNNTIDAISFITLDFSVKISKHNNLLTHEVLVFNLPDTQGLMGTADGNKDNDLMSPNGQSTWNSINEFAETWKVSENASLFDTDSTFGVSNNLTFSLRDFPRTVDDVLKEVTDNETEKTEIRTNCKEDLFCLQDYWITKDYDSALSVLEQGKQLTAHKNFWSTVPPHFTNSSGLFVINATSVFTLTLTVSDTTVTQFTHSGSLANEGGINLNGSVFTWNLTEDLSALRVENYPKTLKFYAKNAQNVTAEYAPQIKLCLCDSPDQCSNELAPLVSSSGENNGNVFSLACDCGEKASWKYCENKIVDVCQNCYNSTTCNATLDDYCGVCPEGFQGNGKTCRDDDECANNNGGCDQTCTNYPGNYSCSCKDGYRQNGTKCLEINECEENITACPHDNQICINLPVFFECQCYPGFFGENCTIKAPFVYIGIVVLAVQGGWNFLELTDTSSGTYMSLAANLSKSIEEALSISGKFTVDSVYVNVLSFEPGATIPQGGSRRKRAAADTSVKAIYELHLPSEQSVADINKALADGHSCNSTCQYYYINIVGDPPSIDVNDNPCNYQSVHKCDLETTVCDWRRNRIFCDCKKGYEAIGIDPYHCKDIDECRDVYESHICDFDSVCVDLVGSYECKCPSGFEWNATLMECVGDKCSTKPCKHDGICTVTDNEQGFVCICEYEWDGPTCEDEDIEARKMKIAVICISVILGFLCLALLIIVIVMCVKRNRTLESDSYTNNRYNEFTGLPRAKVQNQNGKEMAENGHDHDPLNSKDAYYTSFGRHSPTPADKKEGSKNVYYNRAYDEEVGERL